MKFFRRESGIFIGKKTWNKGKKMIKKMDHIEYPKKLKKLDIVSLKYIIKDCQETIQVNPTGENVGYYLDEINYCSDEIFRRSRSEKK